MASSEPWYVSKLRPLANPLFWVPFISIVIFKLAIFHYASISYLLLGRHPTFDIHFEVGEYYSDFTFYYMNFVRLFVQGNLPYTEALYTIDGIQVYIYPPLYLYILTAFYYIPSDLLFPDIVFTAATLGRDLDFLRVGFVFIVFDLATCVLIYITARKLTTNRAIPVVVMSLYALNPVSLWWGNYLWLSTPIHTFFLVLGFYFMIRGDLRWAALWITVATMVKQTAAFLLPVILFLEYRQGMKRVLTSLGIMMGVALVLSMPYLLLYPLDYLRAVMSGMGSYRPYDTPPAPTFPVPISTLAIYWPEPFKFIVFTAVSNGIPWAVSLGGFWILAFLIPEQHERQYREQIVLLALLLSLALHLFLARGIYKYYLIALLPFLILFGAVLRGQLVPYRSLNCPLSTRLQPPIPRLKVVFNKMRIGFRNLGSTAANNVNTWWFVIVGLASIGIFIVHRYFTHLILLLLFLTLIIYGFYNYYWRKRQREKNVLEKLQSQSVLNTDSPRPSNRE
ncbi:MAG: hypothetical protein ACFE8O_01840 [Candidatus Hermodarchaeota archaeon]